MNQERLLYDTVCRQMEALLVLADYEAEGWGNFKVAKRLEEIISSLELLADLYHMRIYHRLVALEDALRMKNGLEKAVTALLNELEGTL